MLGVGGLPQDAKKHRKGVIMKNITQRTASKEVQIGEQIQIHGSIYKIRRMRGFAFVILRAQREMIQCIYSPEYSNFDLETLKEEASIRLMAYVAAESRSKTGWELQMQKVEVLSSPAAIPPVVINQKEVVTSMESLLDYRPVTLRNERQRAIFKIQEGICQGMRRFLERENFTEVHTPKIVFAGAEGGANLFKLGYFGKEAYLAQSPQFYKQMMVGVFDRVMEIGPVFRAEKHNTKRHLNEYTGLDFEMGYIDDFTDIMAMETGFLQYMVKLLKEEYSQELALLKAELPEVEQIPAVTFAEAKRLASEKYGTKMKNPYDLEPEEEHLIGKYFKEEYGSDFVFVTHYPSKKRPFYTMDDPEDPEYTLSFDLLFRGLEITSGGQRVHDYNEQVAKMEKLGMNPEEFATYLMLHKYGAPPHGGMGLGLDRIIMLMLGAESLRDVIAFPKVQNMMELMTECPSSVDVEQLAELHIAPIAKENK